MKSFIKLSIILILSLYINANENNSTEDNFEKADIKRDGYMPRLITPDSLKSGVYGGLALSAGLISYKTDIDNDNTSLDLSLITGYNFNNYLAAEGRATISIANDNSIDYQKFSLFLKPKYELYEGFNLYSLFGVGKVKAKSVNTDSTYSSKTSVQIGIGTDYKLKDNFKFFADYTYQGENKNAKFNNQPATLKAGALTAGITYDF